MADLRWRCKHCWAEEEEISDIVKTEGWRSVSKIRVEDGRDGKKELVYEKGRVEHDGFHEHEEFKCEKCEKVAYRLEDLVEQYDAAPHFICRRCDWAGSELADHPLSCPEDPERVRDDEPLPGQESLDIAA